MISSSINNSFAIGVKGIQDGIAGADNAAKRIARAGVDGPQGTGGENAVVGSGSIAEPIIDLKLYSRSVEASAQIVKTADETLGSLLDIMA